MRPVQIGRLGRARNVPSPRAARIGISLRAMAIEALLGRVPVRQLTTWAHPD